MKIEYMCSNCGHKLVERCGLWNMYYYGSKIRVCKKCGTEIYDNRWREVALEGFHPNRERDNKSIKFFLLGSIIVSLLAGAWKVYDDNYVDLSYMASSAILATAVICSVFLLIALIRLGCGFEKRAHDKYMEESKKRLSDPAYVEKLRKNGWNV